MASFAKPPPSGRADPRAPHRRERRPRHAASGGLAGAACWSAAGDIAGRHRARRREGAALELAPADRRPSLSAEAARHRASAEAAAIERDQAFPMALGAGDVIDLAFRKCEAVMKAGIDLELARGA